MNQRLAIIVPVHNGQAALNGRLLQLLEAAADLRCEFEIVVVDDGSTDRTEEIACDLAKQYPQIRVARHARPLGMRAAVATAVSENQGQVTFVQHPDLPVRCGKLRSIWRMHQAESNAPAAKSPKSSPATPGGPISAREKTFA